MIDVNLTGTFLTAKAAIPQLRETGGGSMVLVSSICGLTASAGFGAYNASKHGVIGLMRTLAHELRVRRGQRQRRLPRLGPHADARRLGRRGRPTRASELEALTADDDDRPADRARTR